MQVSRALAPLCSFKNLSRLLQHPTLSQQRLIMIQLWEALIQPSSTSMPRKMISLRLTIKEASIRTQVAVSKHGLSHLSVSLELQPLSSSLMKWRSDWPEGD